MGEEKRTTIHDPHTLRLTQRNKVEITGVTDVLRFDEEAVAVDTTCGLLLLKGSNLHVGNLNLQDGEILVDGEIDEIAYTEGTQPHKSGLFSRLLR